MERGTKGVRLINKKWGWVGRKTRVENGGIAD
jgi:hypothetical protein